MHEQVNEERLGISELAEAAGVSVRTVRYYIAEGLLPPPAGARSHYTREHLDRLRLIGQLKEAYLPLREIRRHLTAMDHKQVQQVSEPDRHEGVIMEEPARYVPQAPPPAQSGFIHGQEDLRPPDPKPDAPGSAAEYIRRLLADPRRRQGGPPRQPTRQAPAPATPEPAPDAVAWRRIALADGAELLVREDLYHRRSDKIEWLAGWARSVLE
jgi:DNA-binding transcriptional MerR regulator